MSEHEIVKYTIPVGYCLLFSRGILFIICLKSKLFNNKTSYRYLFWYALIAFLIATLESSLVWLVNQFPTQLIPILQTFKIENTFFISPLYYLNEIMGIGLLFSGLLKPDIGKRVYILTIFLFICEIINTIFLEGYRESQTYGSLIFSIGGIVLSCLYLTEFMKGNFNTTLFRKPSFLIIIAIFISNSLSVFIYFITRSLFREATTLFYKISIFRMTIDALCFILMSYGIWLLRSSNSNRKIER